MFTNVWYISMRITVYANIQYVIKWTIFFTCEGLYFGILESYAIKRLRV